MTEAGVTIITYLLVACHVVIQKSLPAIQTMSNGMSRPLSVSAPSSQLLTDCHVEVNQNSSELASISPF